MKSIQVERWVNGLSTMTESSAMSESGVDNLQSPVVVRSTRISSKGVSSLS